MTTNASTSLDDIVDDNSQIPTQTGGDQDQSAQQPQAVSTGGPEGAVSSGEKDHDQKMEERVGELDKVLNDYGLITDSQEKKTVGYLTSENNNNPPSDNELLEEMKK